MSIVEKYRNIEFSKGRAPSVSKAISDIIMIWSVNKPTLSNELQRKNKKSIDKS
jgi:hypothetical protein